MSRVDEWRVRSKLLSALLEILADGQPRSARDLVVHLSTVGITADKRLVNSVLYSEGRRYVWHDQNTFTYTLTTMKSDIPATATFSDESAPHSSPSLVKNNIDTAISHETKLSSEANKSLQVRLHLPSVDYILKSASVASPAIFDVESFGNKIHIVLNYNHPLYSQLISVLEPLQEDKTKSRCMYSEQVDMSDATNSSYTAAETIFFLLSAWAHFESTEPIGPRRSRSQHSRDDWGRAARELYEEKQND